MQITKDNILAAIVNSESETIEFKENFGDEAQKLLVHLQIHVAAIF